jgi:hypothetical protein
MKEMTGLEKTRQHRYGAARAALIGGDPKDHKDKEAIQISETISDKIYLKDR